MTDETTLTILLIEDNPGDARYIREILREATELPERTAEAGSGASASVGAEQVTRERAEPTVIRESRLEPGIERLDSDPPDVVLLDLDLPDSTGLDTLSAVLERTEETPVVVLTGLRDRQTGMEALRRGADEYLVKDEINADILTRSIFHTMERNEQERQLRQQREQLAALNQLNSVVQDITGAVLRQSSREEIERLVCERLAETESYLFAWIGGVERANPGVTVQAEAGTGDYLDEVDVTYDDSETGQGPTGRAIQTKEMQVVQHVLEDPDFEPWRDTAVEYGVRSSAAIPIVHDGILYGVLNVYSARPEAFGGEEREVVGTLGDIVGHAIAAIERKEALISDNVVEIEFEIRNIFDSLGGGSGSGTITLDRTIRVDEDHFLTYGSADEEGRETLQKVVEALPSWDSVSEVGERDGMTRFSVRLTDPPVVALVASQGGRVREAKIEDGDYRVVVHLPQGADVRRVVDGVQEAYPDARVIAQRHTTRTERSDGEATNPLDNLTERQRSVLESAFYGGFFEWPRESSGKEIAETLGISAPTFTQHMRAAEQKIMSSLLGE
ncbi:bacterio-opsin activator domain-containing protein [Halopelagius longus]|uniref:Predicted DNA binding protein, contains HTH domain n=1 Tax=Halopelagius longus TaxID=1236180 RepID=A0A1H1EHG2_9EURY|nr:bacterio-opsin activator domain-containing protein [Halopelagius longus]RDI71760.1 response regulator [Halopelagius longus]SDQ88235.1 Predicted DNA binding protein, contains HTH domain [Halopelagius longus]